MKILEVTDKETFLKTLPLLNQLMVEENTDPVSEEQAWTGFEKASKTGFQLFYTSDNNVIIGVLGLRAMYDPLEKDVGFEVNDLIVSDDRRGEGIGTALFEFATNKAKECGANWIRLMVLKENDKAQEFYKKHNFKNVADLMLWEKQT